MTTTGLSAAGRALAGRAARLAAWWTGELCALVPRSWRRALAGGMRRLLIDVDGTRALVALDHGEGAHELAALTLAEGRWQGEAALSAARGASADEVVVRVPAHQALRHRLSLPLAVQENLRQVLVFEMDRNTPFKAEQVYFDYTVAARDARQQKLQVQLTLIPRPQIDPLLSTLQQAGVPATSLSLLAEEPAPGRAVELLPKAPGGRTGRLRRARVVAGLAGLALLLLVTAVLVPLVQKHRALTQLEAQVQDARALAAQAQALRQELEQQIAESNVLAERRNARPFAIHMIDEITRLLPDSTWLTRFEIAGGKVKLHGESANASEVATLIVGSALFADASFEAPVTRDLRTGRERFLLSAEIEGARGQ